MAKAVCGIPLSQAERAERRVNCRTYGLPPHDRRPGRRLRWPVHGPVRRPILYPALEID